jgi:hypothetical protein
MILLRRSLRRSEILAVQPLVRQAAAHRRGIHGIYESGGAARIHVIPISAIIDYVAYVQAPLMAKEEFDATAPSTRSSSGMKAACARVRAL